MRNQGLPAATIARLQAETQTRFSDKTAWQAHLDCLGFNALKVTPDPVRVATEGALWGSVQAHEFLCDTVILSDRACPCEGARGFAHLHSNFDPSNRPRWTAWNCSIPRLNVIGPGGL